LIPFTVLYFLHNVVVAEAQIGLLNVNVNLWPLNVALLIGKPTPKAPLEAPEGWQELQGFFTVLPAHSRAYQPYFVFPAEAGPHFTDPESVED